MGRHKYGGNNRVAPREHYGRPSKQIPITANDGGQQLGVSESHFVTIANCVAVSSRRLPPRPKKELSIKHIIQWTGCVLSDVRCFVWVQSGSHDLVIS
jgi:hypothetical protein